MWHCDFRFVLLHFRSLLFAVVVVFLSLIFHKNPKRVLCFHAVCRVRFSLSAMNLACECVCCVFISLRHHVRVCALFQYIYVSVPLVLNWMDAVFFFKYCHGYSPHSFHPPLHNLPRVALIPHCLLQQLNVEFYEKQQTAPAVLLTLVKQLSVQHTKSHRIHWRNCTRSGAEKGTREFPAYRPLPVVVIVFRLDLCLQIIYTCHRVHCRPNHVIFMIFPCGKSVLT